MYQDLKKFSLPNSERGKSKLVVQLWRIVQATIFHHSFQFMYGWRNFLLKLFCAKIGKGVLVRPSAQITFPWNLEIGDYAWVGDDVVIYNWAQITIESNAVVAQRSYLCTASHDYTVSTFDQFAKPIIISEQSWVATDVFVAPGVTIGRGAVIGARSSVYKDMPEGMICVGNPAKPVRHRYKAAS